MRRASHSLIIVGGLLALGATSICVADDDMAQFFTAGHVDGQLRAYNYDRFYATTDKANARAFSGAILLNVQSGTVANGFSVGVSAVSANALGTKPDTPADVDVSLMGPGNSVTALSQAFLQFENGRLLVRAGDQYLDTPWMGSNDSRVLPSSYEAILAQVTPSQGWTIVGIRSLQWKSRTSDGFHADNLYYPSTYDGDSMYGNNASLPLTARRPNGTWTIGTTYASEYVKAESWYYDFLGFGRMAYVDGTYKYKLGSDFAPFVSAQYADEVGGPDNILVETQTELLGVAGDRVRSRIIGADVGASVFNGQIDLAYNQSAQQQGAVGLGSFVTPYTITYATDPLYTTSMLRGLVEQGPGHAWKAKAEYAFLDDTLRFVMAYTKYSTTLRGDSHDVYFDVVYDFKGALHGLSLRNRFEHSEGGINDLNPGNKPFSYNRVMLSYKF